jgi:RsbRD-like negative regulator of sigma factor
MTGAERLQADLRERQPAIAKAWLARMLAVYPDGGAGFLAKQKDQFKNPLRATLEKGAVEVTKALFADAGREELEHRLDGLVRLRAVQDMPPSKALAFVPELAEVVREEMGDGNYDAAEFAKFDAAIRDLTMLSFDVYVGCREQIYELRARMMRDRSYQLMKRAGLLWEEEPDEDNGMKRGET